MKMISPNSNIKMLDIFNSIYKVLTGNISFGSPTAFDNAGTGITYNTDNTDGVLIRVGASSNPNVLPNSWGANNTPVTITHNLNRRPVGYLVMCKDKTCDVYSGNPFVADLNTISLAITDGSADTLLYIF
jgi:hypothetical protein